MMNFVLKMMNFALKLMNLVLKTRNCVSKTRSFVLKMMDFAALPARARGDPGAGMLISAPLVTDLKSHC